ncbi:unnamed protein product [Anisakis simplex]|uniref:Secreted protein n=1 Tax=Anisakis simplex TaxID=6269 RepID=A0A0M3JYV1_ANISI|nr:unnamed protein product [Anisakis simplex]
MFQLSLLLFYLQLLFDESRRYSAFYDPRGERHVNATDGILKKREGGPHYSLFLVLRLLQHAVLRRLAPPESPTLPIFPGLGPALVYRLKTEWLG